MKTTVKEAAEIINNEFTYCFAYVEGATIEVTVRGKKTDKVYIRNGAVSFKGRCETTAGEIADLLGLERNF